MNESVYWDKLDPELSGMPLVCTPGAAGAAYEITCLFGIELTATGLLLNAVWFFYNAHRRHMAGSFKYSNTTQSDKLSQNKSGVNLALVLQKHLNTRTSSMQHMYTYDTIADVIAVLHSAVSQTLITVYTSLFSKFNNQSRKPIV
jgi:hypothetical protein